MGRGESGGHQTDPGPHSVHDAPSHTIDICKGIIDPLKILQVFLLQKCFLGLRSEAYSVCNDSELLILLLK